MAKHRKAVRPAEEPRFLIPGKRRKGCIRWNAEKSAYSVTFSFLVGDIHSYKPHDYFTRWHFAMNEYREHDRRVIEKMNEYVARHAESV